MLLCIVYYAGKPFQKHQHFLREHFLSKYDFHVKRNFVNFDLYLNQRIF